MKQEDDQHAPEAWISREVTIGIGSTGGRVTGELREVNDRGVIIHLRPEGTHKPARVFYPWRNVQAIQLPDEE